MKYFSENELVEMKNIVIKSHIQQRKSSPFTSHFSQNESNNAHKNVTINALLDKMDHFNKLPTEILTKIFASLTLRDKLRGACVSKMWNQLVYDKFHWKKLCFTEWKNGYFLIFFIYLLNHTLLAFRI